MGPALSAATQSPRRAQIPTLQEAVSYPVQLLFTDRDMMESICLDDESADPDWDWVERGYSGPQTPSTSGDNHEDSDQRPQYQQDASDGSDDEYGGSSQAVPKRKKGGYDSRVEQILYENPDLPILIVDAGKSLESGGKYIVYTIRTGVSLSGLFISSN